MVLKYKQAYGASDGDLIFKYRDAASYDIGGDATSTASDAYRAGLADGSESSTPYTFANADSFQLISFGMDGASGAPGNVNGVNTATATRTDDTGAAVVFDGTFGADNLCNFAEGRLERFVIDNE